MREKTKRRCIVIFINTSQQLQSKLYLTPQYHDFGRLYSSGCHPFSPVPDKYTNDYEQEPRDISLTTIPPSVTAYREGCVPHTLCIDLCTALDE